MFQQPVNYPTIVTTTGISYSDDYAPGVVSGSWGVDEARCNRTYTNRLKALTTSQNCGPAQVVQSCPVRIGQTYQFPVCSDTTENDTGSFAQSITAVRDTEGGGKQWSVTIEYGPFDIPDLLGTSDISNGIINPLDRYYDVYWGEPAKYRKSKPADESTPDPLPYLNTAGDPLLDPPETEETRPILFFVRNEATYNDAYASQYKDTVNQDEFLGFPPNSVKCRDIKGERFFDSDWGWWFKVYYQFEFDDDDDGNGFTQLIASMGYRQLVDGSGDPVNCTDGDGSQVTDAVPLQKDGSYQPGEPPYFIPFQQFSQSKFADLNIPDDLLYVASGNS